MFLGLPGKLFYEVCMLAYLFGTLYAFAVLSFSSECHKLNVVLVRWLYGVVASTSMTTYVPVINLTTDITW